MPIPFNVPSWFQPRDYSWIPKSIDQVFDAFARAKAARQMEAQGALQNAALGLPAPSQMTPDIISRAMGPVQGGYIDEREAQIRDYLTRQAEARTMAQQKGALDFQKAQYEAEYQRKLASGDLKPGLSPVAGGEGQVFTEYGKNGPEFQYVKPPSESSKFYTIPQASELVGPKNSAKLQTLFPDGKVPMEFAHQLAMAGKSALTLGEKDSQFDQKQFSEAVKRVNPNNAPRGSLLGMAGQLNARAERALRTLGQKDITPQNINQAVEDLVSIMANGRPNEAELASQGYQTLEGKIAEMKQYLSSKPQNVELKGVVDKLKNDLRLIKDVDNQVIKDNIDIVEAEYPWLVDKHSAKWEKAKSTVLRGLSHEAAVGGQTSDGGPAAPKLNPGERVVPLVSPTGVRENWVYSGGKPLRRI